MAKNIFKSGELEKRTVTEKSSTTANGGKSSSDAIILVGYRISSIRTTQFQQ
jgi:hypothetical protein